MWEHVAISLGIFRSAANMCFKFESEILKAADLQNILENH